jgi:NosR/NirI family nitrous oxide reductase transcriptional regulator
MHDNRIHFHMRSPIVQLTIVAFVVGAITVGQTQSAPLSIDAKLQGQLKQVVPSAASFSPKMLDPPHFKAFAPSQAAGQQTVGIAFWTTEIEPLERGYDGPIKILVGMDMQGILTGIVVAQHHEPYGDFSIEPAQFAAQFKGKSVRDGFRVGADIDAVSRATISVTSAARAIRNSARRMATQLLVPPK